MNKMLEAFGRMYGLSENMTSWNTHFVHLFLKKGEHIQVDIRHSQVVAVIHGAISLDSNHLWHRDRIETGEFFVLLKCTYLRAEILEDTELLIMKVDSFADSKELRLLRGLTDLKKGVDYNLDSLVLRPELMTICHQVLGYLERQQMTPLLAEIKRLELFYNLLQYYTKEQLVHLYYPLLSTAPDFRVFVYSNYNKVKNVKELIDLSHMSKSLFYQKFKEEFHTSAKQWMLGKVLDRIRMKAGKPGITVKELMKESGSESLPQFHTFCKRFFQSTPREFIDAQQKVHSIIQ